MRIDTFLHELKQCGGVRLTADVILFRKPIEIYNLETRRSVLFRTIEEAMGYQLGDHTIKEIVENADMALFVQDYDGGRGGSGENTGEQKTFKFGHASGGGRGDVAKRDFPSRVNINIRNPEATLEAFRKLHVNDSYESAFAVDENGYVTQYVHGGATSVGIWGKRGEMIYHNHPNGGAFSDSDLISASLGAEKGIVASGKSGDYIFVKGNHFKANAFAKAVRNARPQGTSYDDAVSKWLEKNQKKYGYRFEFRKAR